MFLTWGRFAYWYQYIPNVLSQTGYAAKSHIGFLCCKVDDLQIGREVKGTTLWLVMKNLLIWKFVCKKNYCIQPISNFFPLPMIFIFFFLQMGESQPWA